MAIVERDISTKPVTERHGEVQEVLNREVVPVLRTVRKFVNAELRSNVTVVGDGLSAGPYDISNPYSSDSVLVLLRDTVTGEFYDRSDGYVVTSLNGTVSVTAPLPVPVDGLEVLVRV